MKDKKLSIVMLAILRIAVSSVAKVQIDVPLLKDNWQASFNLADNANKELA